MQHIAGTGFDGHNAQVHCALGSVLCGALHHAHKVGGQPLIGPGRGAGLAAECAAPPLSDMILVSGL